jgi:putative sporulation protein YyaC
MFQSHHYLDKKAVPKISDAVLKYGLKLPQCSEIVILCIGTHKYTGDSLGPLIGTELKEYYNNEPLVHIYGTTEKPVHALNIHKIIDLLLTKHPAAYIIAVDACLGQFYKIGTLQVVGEPLKPGIGLGKNLPEIGHIQFKGIVNNFKALNHKVLENTSLTFVQEMAKVMRRILVLSTNKQLSQLSFQREKARSANKQNTSSSL